MADTVKISALDELTSGSLKDTTVFPVVDGGVTKKVRLDSLQAYMNDTLVTDSELSSEISSVNSTINALTTDDVTENTNLYYTDARVKTKLNSEGVLSGSLTSDNISDFDTAVSESAASSGFGSGGGGTALTVSDTSTTVGDVSTIVFTADNATIGVTDAGSGVAGVNINVASTTTDTTALGNHTASLNFFTSSYYGNTLISGAQQIENLGFVTSSGGGGSTEIPQGTISGSDQILGLGFITGGTFLSSSGQVQLVLSNRLGWDTSFTPENANFLYYTNARVEQHLNTIGLLTASAGGGTISGSITSSGQIAYGEIKNTPKFWPGEGISIVSGSLGDTNNYVLITATGAGGGGLDSAEFYSFTSSYLLEKDSFITGASQIEALGFDPNAGSVTELNAWTGSSGEFGIISQSIDSRLSAVEESTVSLPDGLVSGSSQIDYTQIPNVPSFVAGDNVTILQDPLGVYQISASVDAGAATVPDGTISSSGQIVDFGLFFTGSYFDLPSKITGSGIEYTTLKNIPTGFISSSQQITNFGFISESAAAPIGTISGSAQIIELGFITGGNFFSSSTQISESGFISRNDNYWQGFSASAEFRLTSLEGGTTFAILEGTNRFTGSQYISGSVTADEFVVSSVGEPIIYSATNLNLSASAGTVIVNSSPLRLASYLTSETSSITAQNGDMIYVSDTNKFMVREFGVWEEMRGHENLIINTSSSLALGISAGTFASQSVETGTTSVGHFSAFNYRTGLNNTNVGFKSNQTAYESVENTAIGAYSMELNTSGSSNVAIGVRSLQNNSDGSDNVAIGTDSLNSNTTGPYNVGVGSDSLRYNSTGQKNVGIGYKAAQFNESGSNNIAVGGLSLLMNKSGSRNIAIGERAGGFIEENDNIYIGYAAGEFNYSGSRNIYIGNYIEGSLHGDDNQIVIGSYTTSSGANTTTIGNDNTTDTYIAGNVLPIENEAYDLGSPTKRWKDLYLSGSTIDLGGTLITRNTNGNIEFLDSGSLIQKSIELAAITGSVYVSETVTVGEAMKLSPQHPLPSGQLGMLAVSGSGGGPFGLHFHNGSTWLEISFI